MMKNLFKSFLYTIISILLINLSIRVDFGLIICNWHDLSIFGAIKVGCIIFMVLYIFIGILLFSISAIKNLFLFFYYGVFYDDKHDSITIKVDDNDIIRESFMEFKDGRIIPIHIKKIVTRKPKSEEEIEETKNE